jgi:hypothetical protein
MSDDQLNVRARLQSAFDLGLPLCDMPVETAEVLLN